MGFKKKKNKFFGRYENPANPKLKFTFQQISKQEPPSSAMTTPAFETLTLTSFIKRVQPSETVLTATWLALIKGCSLPRKSIAKTLGKALNPVTLYVHPDKVPEDDKGLGKSLFTSMRNPATGAIFKEIRAVARAEVWYRNAWATAVYNSLGMSADDATLTESLRGTGISINTPEQQREAMEKVRGEREEDEEIADDAERLQSKLKAKYTKKLAAGDMCTDSTAIVIYTDTFLSKSIDTLRVGGVTKEDRAAIYRDIFKAVSHITSELNTPTRTQPVTESDTESDDENMAMEKESKQASPMSAPPTTLKRTRDNSESDISVGGFSLDGASSTKRARTSLGRGTPISAMGHLAPIINLAANWALVLKADNPARRCKASDNSSVTYFTTISKVFQRNFPMEGTVDQESIEELTKVDILCDKECWPESKKNGDQKAQMRKLCAWGRFQDYIASLDQEEYEALLTNLPMTKRKTVDVRYLGMD